MSQSQQGRQSKAMAAKTGKPKLLSWTGQCQTGPGVAQGQSRLLAKTDARRPKCVTRFLKRKPIENISNMASLSDGPSDALQDVLNAQQAVLIGLIANLTGYALQDHIAMTIRRMQQTGIDILKGLNHNQGDCHDSKISDLSQPYPHHPPTVQLGGSPPGARPLY
jgi:hypothetical protein